MNPGLSNSNTYENKEYTPQETPPKFSSLCPHMNEVTEHATVLRDTVRVSERQMGDRWDHTKLRSERKVIVWEKLKFQEGNQTAGLGGFPRMPG